MSKSLGQVAYEAYYLAKTGFGNSHDWSREREGGVTQQAWQAAAEAVVNAYARPVGGDEQIEWLEQLGKREAVIEAAKAQNVAHDEWIAAVSNVVTGAPPHKVSEYRAACVRTNKRVRALIAAEKGGE